MQILKDIAGNYALICSMLGWFVASVFKILIACVKDKKLDFRKLYASGGMPSSHSATVCSLATCVAKADGFNSTSFAVSFMFAFIVMYDATGVRRAAGEQAKILNHLVTGLSENKPIYFTKKLKELIGHTPLEVVVGALLGILIALLVPYNG